MIGDFTGEDARGHANAYVNDRVGVEDGVGDDFTMTLDEVGRLPVEAAVSDEGSMTRVAQG